MLSSWLPTVVYQGVRRPVAVNGRPAALRKPGTWDPASGSEAAGDAGLGAPSGGGVAPGAGGAAPPPAPERSGSCSGSAGCAVFPRGAPAGGRGGPGYGPPASAFTRSTREAAP